jgi:hypothetical protein
MRSAYTICFCEIDEVIKMKMRFAALSMAALLATVGCNQGTPGGPGAVQNPGSTTANRPTYKDSERTFTMTVPTLRTDVKQGDTKDIKIGISRGKEFDQDVKLTMTGLPQGVTIEPANPMIKNSDKEVTLHMHAAADAALGDFTVKVMGRPNQGADATNDLAISVSKND